MGLWCEGVAGKFDVVIKEIYATNADISARRLQIPVRRTTLQSNCAGLPQKNLKFGSHTIAFLGALELTLPTTQKSRLIPCTGISSITAADVGLPNITSQTETLTEAICCDSQYAGYAEPNGFMNTPQVSLFPKLVAERLVTGEQESTFYDSVCGIPLFRAPRNRTFAEFRRESEKHGWPSFRKEEIISGL